MVRAPAHPSDRFRRRDGIALLAALAVMALVALLVVGSVVTMVLAQRSSRLARSDAVLTAAADYALNSVLGDPTGYALADLPYGTTRTFAISVPGPEPMTATVAATRVRAAVLWLVASSTLDGVDYGTRRVNLVAHFASIGSLPSAAIVSRGKVALASDVLFPPDTATEPDCGAASVTADIVVAPGAEVVGAGTAHVTAQQSAGDSATYFITDRQSAALSGAPSLLHVRGDTVVAGGSFDGILVVDGSLTVTGPFVATGLVIARGRIDAESGGFTVVGGLMSFAAPTDGTPAIDLAGASIRADGCRIARAFRLAFPPRPVRDRSWAELF